MSEIKLEEKRVALRRALKREYMRQAYHPENIMSGKRVFDAAFYRWSAIHNSQEILVRRNWRAMAIYFGTFILPVQRRLHSVKLGEPLIEALNQGSPPHKP